MDIEGRLTGLDELDLLESQVNTIVLYLVLTKRCVGNSIVNAFLGGEGNRIAPCIDSTDTDILGEGEISSLDRLYLADNET